MDYNLPDLPVGQRWNVKPSILENHTELVLQEKCWWGWRKIDRAVISNDAVAGWITFHAKNILKKDEAVIQYGIKDGTL